ncbi:MAG: DUF2752 domain-containing protein [Pirellulaceae bacterium]|nr:DUF2752 domain-containing protein [Pirellulaceae bacterium]
MSDDLQATANDKLGWPIQLVTEPASRLPDVSRSVVVAVVLWSVLILAISGLGYLTGSEIIVCHLRRWTGWPCPMCGGTRMVLSLLSGRITDAFWFNPLLFVTLIAAGGWFGWPALTGYRFRVRATWFGWWALCLLGFAAVVANWIYLVAK